MFLRLPSLLAISLVVLVGCSEEEKNKQISLSGDTRALSELVHIGLRFEVRDPSRLSAELRSLYEALQSGSPVSHSVITRLWVEKHRNDFNKRHPDQQITETEAEESLNILAQGLDPADSLKLRSSYEKSLDDLLRKRSIATPLMYNSDAVSIFDVIQKGQLQSYSGTVLDQVMNRRLKDAITFLTHNHVVIFEDGHMLPGRMYQNKAGKWEMKGFDPIVENPEVPYGLTEDFEKKGYRLRVVTANYFAILELFKEELKDVEEVRLRAYKQTARKYGIPLTEITGAETSSEKKSSLDWSPLTFGKINTKTGSLNRAKERETKGYPMPIGGLDDAEIDEEAQRDEVLHNNDEGLQIEREPSPQARRANPEKLVPPKNKDEKPPVIEIPRLSEEQEEEYLATLKEVTENEIEEIDDWIAFSNAASAANELGLAGSSIAIQPLIRALRIEREDQTKGPEHRVSMAAVKALQNYAERSPKNTETISRATFENLRLAGKPRDFYYFGELLRAIPVNQLLFDEITLVLDPNRNQLDNLEIDDTVRVSAIETMIEFLGTFAEASETKDFRKDKKYGKFFKKGWEALIPYLKSEKAYLRSSSWTMIGFTDFFMSPKELKKFLEENIEPTLIDLPLLRQLTLCQNIGAVPAMIQAYRVTAEKSDALNSKGVSERLTEVYGRITLPGLQEGFPPLSREELEILKGAKAGGITILSAELERMKTEYPGIEGNLGAEKTSQQTTFQKIREAIQKANSL